MFDTASIGAAARLPGARSSLDHLMDTPGPMIYAQSSLVNNHDDCAATGGYRDVYSHHTTLRNGGKSAVPRTTERASVAREMFIRRENGAFETLSFLTCQLSGTRRGEEERSKDIWPAIVQRRSRKK